MRKEYNKKKTGGELLLLLGIFILWAILVSILSIGDSIISLLLIFPLLNVFIKKGLKPIWVGRIILMFFILNVFYHVSLTNDMLRGVETSNKSIALVTSTLIQNVVEFGVITEEDERNLNDVIKRLKFLTDFEGDVMKEAGDENYPGGPRQIVKTDLNKLTNEEKIELIINSYTPNGIAFGLLLVFVLFLGGGEIETSGNEHILENRKILNVILWICSFMVYGYTIYVLNPIFDFY